MVYQTKRMAGYLFAFLAVVQLAAFFLYSFVTSSVNMKWLVLLVYWLREAAEAAVPILCAALALLLWRAGHRRALLFPALPVLSRALYFLPDHYLFYIADDLTTAEALAMAGAVTLLECAAIWGFTALLYLIAKCVYKHSGKEEKEEEYGFFSLDDPFIKSVFSISFAYFCLQIAIELINTVSYLVANAGTYTLEEILTILLSFILHLCILMLMQVAAVAYIRYARRHYLCPDQTPSSDKNGGV